MTNTTNTTTRRATLVVAICNGKEGPFTTAYLPEIKGDDGNPIRPVITDAARGAVEEAVNRALPRLAAAAESDPEKGLAHGVRCAYVTTSENGVVTAVHPLAVTIESIVPAADLLKKIAALRKK